MSTKLTLTIDETVIQQAKSYAKLQESSLSSIIENYLKSLVKEKTTSKNEFSPIVRSLKSSFTAQPDFDYKKELKNKLSEKYL